MIGECYLGPVLPVPGHQVGGVHHHPQAAVLVGEEHHLGVVSPVWVFRLHPHCPAAGPHLLTNGDSKSVGH